MSQTLTSSQLTFIDITDQQQLSVNLTSNLSTVQTYNTTKLTYSPSWQETELVVTPQLFLGQKTLQLNDSNLGIHWMRKDGSADAAELTSDESTTNGCLHVKNNNLSLSDSKNITYICYISYSDTSTNQITSVTSQITYTLLEEAQDAKYCSISGAQIFKYDANKDIVGDDVITLTSFTKNVNVKEWQYYNSIYQMFVRYPVVKGENSAFNNDTLNVFANNSTVFNSGDIAKIKLVTTDNDIYDIITITKLYDGATGETGASSCTIMLSNEAYTFPGSETAAKISNVSTQIIVYQGASQKEFKIISIDGKAINTWKTQTNTNGLSFAVEGATVTFYAYETLVTRCGAIPIVISVDGVEYTRTFSWSVAFAGKNATALNIETSSHVFKSTDGIIFTPESITLTPVAQHLDIANLVWFYSVDGGKSWLTINNDNVHTYYNITTKVLTISNDFDQYTNDITSIVFMATCSGASDSVTIARITDGQDAIPAYAISLSNEAQTISTDDEFYPFEAESFACAVTAYKGAQALEPTQDDISQGYYKVVIQRVPDGITVNQSNDGIITFSVSPENTISPSGTIDLVIQLESSEYTMTKSISYSASPSGEHSVVFQIWATNGIEFQEYVDAINLQTGLYSHGIEFTASTYQWSYYDGTWINIESTEDESFGKQSTISIARASAYAMSTIRCQATYKDKAYTQYISLSSKDDTYFATIKTMNRIGGSASNPNVLGTDNDYILAYAAVYKNGQEVDSLLCARYYNDNFTINGTQLSLNIVDSVTVGDYSYFARNNEVEAKCDMYLGQCTTVLSNGKSVWNIINDVHDSYIYKNNSKVTTDSKIACIRRNDVNKDFMLSYDIYTTNDIGNNQLIAHCDRDISDVSDPIFSNTAPSGAKYGQLWIDTSSDCYVLKIYNGASWIPQQYGSHIFTSQPDSNSFKVGDIWVLGENETYQRNLASEKYSAGTMLVSAKDKDTGELYWDEVINENNQVIKSIKECFTFNSTDGVKISQKVTKVNEDTQETVVSEPFYVQITSEEMSFHSRNQTATKTEDVKVVSVGQDTSKIRNATFTGNSGTNFNNDANFNANAKFTNELQITNEKANSNNASVSVRTFAWTVESDGSLSLI